MNLAPGVWELPIAIFQSADPEVDAVMNDYREREAARHLWAFLRSRPGVSFCVRREVDSVRGLVMVTAREVSAAPVVAVVEKPPR